MALCPGGFPLPIQEERQKESKNMGFKVAIAGATGNVGREMLNILSERGFPADEVVALASARSQGTEVSFGDKVLKVNVYLNDIKDWPAMNEVFLGKSFSQQNSNFSEEVNSLIDREVHDLLNGSYVRAKEILTAHIDKLHALASLLKEREKLDYDEFDRFMKGESLPEARNIQQEMNDLRRQAKTGFSTT